MGEAAGRTIHHGVENGLYVRELAPAAAAGTLFYVHGLGESSLAFEGVMASPQLAGWHHLAVDLPGYGKSPWPATSCGLAAHAEQLARFLAARRSAPVVILGHSMGGVIGTLLAAAAPDRVRAFINVEGNISLADCTYSGMVAEQERDVFLAGGLATFLDFIYEKGVTDRPHRTYFASLAMCDPRVLYDNACALVARSTPGTLAADLAALGLPIRYLLGDPRGTGPESRALLEAAGVPWQASAEAGHWPFLDQPAAFAGAVARFLRDL